MRILHLLASPYWSGPAENVALLALGQRALGHEASVAVDRRRTHTSAEELAVPRLEELGLLDDGGLELCVKSPPWAFLRDVVRLRRRQVEVVHAHFSHDHLIARLGRPARAVLVRSIHAPRSLRWSLPGADAFTVPTEAEAARLPGRRVALLPPLLAPEFGPPGDRPALRAALGLAGSPLVGMVSSFQPSRRHALGISAFALLRRQRPFAHLVLVGDGALEPELREQVRAAGLEEAVTFAGYRRGADFVRWLQALDEVWVLGLGNDFSGRAAAQAAACGVRVVAVDEGALARYADAVVTTLAPDAVVASSLEGGRRPAPRLSTSQVATAVIALYERGEVCA